ncbi:uncharacterized protein LOC115990749 [Quercus lobata]|uniref:uncharacterized protein LOC115990749 n=1 Tax=Quercus lobata TaxID=97700 RepID=UPI001247E5EE|nr:uncharacterized protein LOC115990749 [Quercus lobata]
MCLWGSFGKIPRIHGIPKRDKSKPRKSVSHPRHGVTQDRQGSSKAHKKNSSFEQVRFQGYRQMPALFQDLEVGVCLDRRMRSCIPGAKALLEQSTPPKPVQRRGKFILIPGSVSLDTIKAQALADFIVEFTLPDEDGVTNEVDRWIIQTDGSSAQRKGGVGVVITTPDGEVLKYGVQLKFLATNNESKYEGILTGLRLGKALGAKNLLIQSDSKLVIGQIKGEYEAKEEKMQKYLKLTKHLAQEFDVVEFVQIPRSQNMGAYEVSKQASSEGEVSTNLAMEVQKHPSIEEIAMFTIRSTYSWMTPIISYLRDGHLPQNTEETKKTKKRAARFTILNDALYKRGFSMPYLKCVDEEEARYILEEIHGGICGDHAGPRSLVNKVVRTGYFWPTMQVDAVEIVKRCDKYQRYGNVQWLPAERLTTIASPWLFAQWGIVIVGPLPQGKGQVKFLLVAIDYFTKWVEEEALGMITEARIQSFVWKNIICRFGILLTIISDNGRQFDSQGFREFCSNLGIKN